MPFVKTHKIEPNLPNKVFKTSPGNIAVSLVVSFGQVGVEDLHTHLLSTIALFAALKYNIWHKKSLISNMV